MDREEQKKLRRKERFQTQRANLSERSREGKEAAAEVAAVPLFPRPDGAARQHPWLRSSSGIAGPAACGEAVYVVPKVAEETRKIVLVNPQIRGKDQAGALCLRRNKMRGMKCPH